MPLSPLTVSQRMQAIQPPIIPIIGELIRAHPGTISLGQGVVHYGPPAAAISRMQASLDYPDIHKYGPVIGIAPLLELITAKLRTENGIRCEEGYRIVVTAGANMGFLNALFAVADPGDEVILPSPYYFNQEMAIRMLNCTPVLVPTDAAHQLDMTAIRQAITPRTRAIVTISPNNPTGVVYSENSLRAINQLCAEYGLYHICDEAYENFVYDDTLHFSPASLPGAEAHTITLYSLSKAYGFASWRIGYMVIPEHLAIAVLKAQDTNLICATHLAQYGAVGALETGAAYCREKLKAISRVRAMVLKELVTLAPVCSFAEPYGAFYVMLRIDTALKAMTLIERLVKEFRVAALPGTAFGLGGCSLRISYGALDADTVAMGIVRLTQGIRTLAGV